MATYKTASLLYLLCNLGTLRCFSISSFSLGTLCNFQEKLDEGCLEIVKNPRNQLECLAFCGWNDACVGVLVDVRSTRCYHERTCLAPVKCTSFNPNFLYYSKENTDVTTTVSSPAQTTEQDTTMVTTQVTNEQLTIMPTFTTTLSSICQHSGTPITSQKCNCSQTGGWVGDLCERLPNNCSELATFGYSAEAATFTIDIYRNMSLLLKTFCNVGTASDEIGILKHTGEISANRTWNEFVNGFFYNANNYFLGLESLFLYNRQGFTRIGIVLTFASSTVRGSITQEYYNFRISGNSSGYAYTVGSLASASRSVSGSSSSQGFNLSDPFKACQNVPFSTYDNDQDLEPDKNCANLSAAGWWFKDCTPEPVVSPLGNLYNSSRAERIILPSYDTLVQGSREAFKHIYIYLTT